MAAFVVTSAACGLAPGIATLVIGRLLQGAAASIMVPQVLSTIRVTFPVDERPRAFAILGAAIGVAQVSGQILGGLLLNLDLLGLGWRPIFLLNIPVGVTALVLGRAWVPETRATARHLDMVGVGILSGAVALVLVPLIEGRAQRWPAWTILCLILSLPAFAVFTAAEDRIRRSGRTPLVDLRLFRAPAFRAGLAINLAFFASLASFFLTLALFLQDGTGRSALAAGLTFSPVAIGFFAASLAGPRVVARWGRIALSLGETSRLARSQGYEVARVTATSQGSAISVGDVTHVFDTSLNEGGRPGSLLQAGRRVLELAGGRRLVLVADDVHLLEDPCAALVHHLVCGPKVFALVSYTTAARAPRRS